MRKINIENVFEGFKNAKTIFDEDGRILLASGVVIKDAYIEKLRLKGVSELYIEDEISEGITVLDVVCENTRQDAKLIVKDLMENYTLSKAMNTDKVKETVGKLIEELLSNADILISLSDLKLVDDYTFGHSVSVCILSLITGIGLGFNTIRLKDLGVGALLHDIGKLKIPSEILKKSTQLTVEEFEEIKKHTVYGFEILKDNNKISMVSAFIALGHHERYDGSGYPLQLKADNIHQCASIVAVADVYDALTSNVVYRQKMKPHEAAEYIISLSSHHFNKEVVDCFIKYIAIYPIGTGVILNTKERGVVIEANKALPTRPVIRVVFSDKGKRVPRYYEIDLMNNPNVFISEACEL